MKPEDAALPGSFPLPTKSSGAPQVAILICTFNRAESLRRTLASLASLLVPPGLHAELVIVDNNSTDATREVCAAARLPLPLRYIAERQQGQACAQNRGLEETSAPLILFTDDDVDVSSGWLAAYVEAAARHPAAGYFGGPVRIRWESTPPRWFAEHATTLLAHVTVAFDPGEEEGALPGGVVGANMAMRRAAFAGLAFNPALDLCNEVQLINEIRARGFDGISVPGALVHHRTSAERMTERYVRRRFMREGAAEVRRGQIVRDRPWLGVASYYWKQFAWQGLKYALLRAVAPAARWLPVEIEMAKAWGVIAEARAARKQIR